MADVEICYDTIAFLKRVRLFRHSFEGQRPERHPERFFGGSLRNTNIKILKLMDNNNSR